jgi:radical SAM protein with 4Fe4S-binding SPASM domain
MIAYAKSKGIPFITTCTNGDLVNPEKVAQCGLDEVNFQIGGMTQETHQVYRINSQLARVMENLKATIKFRDQSGSKMKIASGFILMKHNEHEVQTFKKTMADLGVDQFTVIDPCVRTHEQGLQYLPSDQAHWQYDPEAFKQGKVRPRFYPPNECPWIYYSLSIHVSGNVVPCCRDPLGENVMGNILKESLDSIWNGPKFREFRRTLHEDQGKINICRLCSSYAPSPIK